MNNFNSDSKKMNSFIYLTLIIIILQEKSYQSRLTDNLSFLFKNTYVVYGTEHRSERKLPVCESASEACNYAHTRPWLLPITERLCRCPKRSRCSLKYRVNNYRRMYSQHISNRAQLKFCKNIEPTTEACEQEELSLVIEKALKQNSNSSQNQLNKRTGREQKRVKLLCRCIWPRQLQHAATLKNSTASIEHYNCTELNRCNVEDTCGYVRVDTYEVYYACKCPENNVCTFQNTNNVCTPQNTNHVCTSQNTNNGHDKIGLKLPLLDESGILRKAVCVKKCN